jgi:hypothetical protein
MSGLLVNKQQIPVPDLAVINPDDADWCRLEAKDCAPRPTSWVRQIILHTTKGNWPQRVHAGRGAGGKARLVADLWRRGSSPSSAHIVIDNDGTVACLCDLATTSASHAAAGNTWSVGIEMYQESGNGIYEAVYDAAVKLIPALCRIFGIQFQIPKLPYSGVPLRRMVDGGELCVGVFGCRDHMESCGRGDPGDEIFARLATAGAESFDHDAGEDLEVWKARQTELNQRGAGLTVDGVPGASTVAALRAAGRQDGIWALG